MILLSVIIAVIGLFIMISLYEAVICYFSYSLWPVYYSVYFFICNSVIVAAAELLIEHELYMLKTNNCIYYILYIL